MIKLLSGLSNYVSWLILGFVILGLLSLQSEGQIIPSDYNNYTVLSSTKV